MHSFFSAVFGHVYRPNGCQAVVDSCDLSLPNLGEHPDSIPQHAVLRFSGTGNSEAFILLGHRTGRNIDTIMFSNFW
jgi:hypothetical protein